MMIDQLLTIDDVADRLRIHRSYVYKLIRLGTLPQPIKLGKSTRIRATELQDALKAFSN
jgi:excisionase family DNA binding protein